MLKNVKVKKYELKNYKNENNIKVIIILKLKYFIFYNTKTAVHILCTLRHINNMENGYIYIFLEAKV